MSLGIGIGLTDITYDAAGNIIPAGYVRVRVNGLQANTALGVVSVKLGYKTSVTGQQLDTSLRSVTARSQTQATPSGLLGIMTLGDVSASSKQSTIVNIGGFVANSSLGTVTANVSPNVNASVNVTGASLPITLGNQSVTVKRNVAAAVTGFGITSATGTVSITVRATITFSVTGSSATGAVGNVVGQFPTFVANGTIGAVTSGTTVSAALPAGNVGDFMIMVAGVIGSNTAFTATSGWTPMTEGNVGANRAAAWYKFRVTNEVTPSVGNAGRTSTNLLTASVSSYRDVKSVRNIQSTFVNSGSLDALPVTIQGRNSMGITAWMRMGANTATAPDLLWTEDRDNGTASGGAGRYYLDSQIVDYPAIIPASSRGGTGNNFMAVSFEAVGNTPDPVTPPNAVTRAMWVRDFPTIITSTNSINELTSTCIRDEITDLYCSVTNTVISSNLINLRTFIDNCTGYGIRVWAMDGSRTYFSDANGISDLQTNVNSVVSFNNGSTVTQKFYGVHLDCSPLDQSPYLAFHDGVASSALSNVGGSGSWQSTQVLDREFLMRDWCAMHATIRGIVVPAGMKLGSSLPTWFENYQGEQIVCTYNSVTQNVYLHLRAIIDNIALQSYSTDPKTVISTTKFEILNSGTAKVSTSVNVKTGGGSGISYADTAGKNTKSAVLADMLTIRNRFNYYPNFTFDNLNDWEGWKVFSPPPLEPSTPDTRQVATVAYGQRTNTTFTASQAQPNDVIFVDMFVGNPGGINTVTPPAGFVQIGTSPDLSDSGGFRAGHFLWWKRLSAVETTWTFSHGNQYTGGKVYCVQLAKLTGNPYDAFSQASGTGQTTSVPSVTNSTNHALDLFTAINWDGGTSINPPTNMTMVANIALLYGAKQVNMPVGITGVRTQNPNGNATSAAPWSAYHIIVPGEGGGGTASLVINGTPTTSGTRNSAITSFTVSGSGGNPPYSYSVFSGTLPTGVTLNSSTGVVSGTPTVAGTYSNIILRVTDANLDTANMTAFSITINEASAILWPKTGDTGVLPGVARTTYTGPATVTTNGTLIENKNINATLTVTGNNVTIRNCKFTINDWYGIIQETGTNLIIEDCEVDGTGSSRMSGVAITNGIVRRCNIHGMVIAVKLWGPVEFRDNYVHDLQENSSDINNRHFDGLAIHNGGNCIIDHNAFHMPAPQGGTASVFITTQYGNTTNVQVTNNLMLGQPSYPAYAENNNSNTMSNIKYINNYMQKGDWGWVYESGGGVGADVSNTKFDTTFPSQVTAWLNAP